MRTRGGAFSLAMAMLFVMAVAREPLQIKPRQGSGGASAKSCSFSRGFSMASASSKAEAVAIADAKATAAAGDSCAKAVVKALGDSCSGGSAIAAINSAATACAAAYAKVHVKTQASVHTEGNAQACASACATGMAYAKSTADAIAQAYGSSTNACEAVSTQLKSRVFVEAVANAYALAFSNACSKGGGNAKTAAEAWMTVTATAVAKALGNVMATSCSKCGTRCRCPADVKYEAESKTDVYSEVVGGTYALTKAVADAGAIFCKDKGRPQAVKTAISTYLKAYADICIKVYGKLYATASSNGAHTFGCSGAFGSYQSISKALSEVVVTAWANNYKDFCADVFSYVEGSALVKDAAKVVGQAFATACSKGGSKTQTTSKDIVEYITQYQPYSEALQQAYSTATNKCPCPSPYLCCSTCDLSKTCPAYKA